MEKDGKDIDEKDIDEKARILDVLNGHYPMRFERIEFIRDSGCTAYAVYVDGEKYFLRVTKPMFFATASRSLDIHLYLQRQGFDVPPVIFTKDGAPCVQAGGGEEKYFYVLYEFIEGEEADPVADAEIIGAFVGRLHQVMKGYPGELKRNDKYYYVDKYIHILREKKYDKADEFAAYGNVLWESVKDLPYGLFCVAGYHHRDFRDGLRG